MISISKINDNLKAKNSSILKLYKSLISAFYINTDFNNPIFNEWENYSIKAKYYLKWLEPNQKYHQRRKKKSVFCQLLGCNLSIKQKVTMAFYFKAFI